MIDNARLIDHLLRHSIQPAIPHLRAEIDNIYKQLATSFRLKDIRDFDDLMKSNKSVKIMLIKLEKLALAVEELADYSIR